MNDCPDAGYLDTCLAVEVRCNWIACVSGLDLCALGRCSARGDWRDPHCAKFEQLQPLGMITRAVLGPNPMEET
jgi:hypothetical protein